ncbi:MAG: CotS family spore coat protein [Desulfitobacteriaceae bacterium]|nr:CotS family spore coat protein [Desulfitobacteriaceae bacterium]MDD4752070.1 CotS family spore coat protein [Desulfitobacteriaceae bacterium]
MKLDPLVLQEYPFQIRDAVQIQDRVFKIDTDVGPMCLKHSDRNEEKVLFIYSVLKHLLESGFRKISPPVPTKRGDPFVKMDGEIYFITKWISGVPCDFHRNNHLKAAVQTLGELHLVAKGANVLPRGKARAMYQRWPKIFQERTEDLKQFKNLVQEKVKKTDFEKKYLHYSDRIIDQAERACAHLSASRYKDLAEDAQKQGTFTHRDVADRNFIIARDRQAYMIDFDYCRYDLRLTDVVRLVERTLKDVSWKPERADFIINEYNKMAPLGANEYMVMKAFFQFPQKAWRVSNRYFKKKKRWQEEGYIKKLKQAVKNTDPKENFINHFTLEYCRQ